MARARRRRRSSRADPDGMVAAVESSVLVVDGTATDDEPGPARTHAGAATVVAARYTKPFLLHGSIGPSCAVARFDGHRLDIQTHSQGVELLAPGDRRGARPTGRVRRRLGTWTAPAATATTAPTTPRSTPR